MGWGAGMYGYYPGYYGAPSAYAPGYYQAPYQQASPEQEIEYLKNQAAAIEEELAAIRNRIEELKTSQKQGK
jgi:hypothetical protein